MAIEQEPVMASVVVLAGKRSTADPVGEAAGVSNKCLAPIDGTPMLARVLQSVSAGGRFREILVSTASADVFHADLCVGALLRSLPARCVDAGASPATSVLLAKDEARTALPLLVTTGDHALLTPEMVSHFLLRATASDADVVVALASRETVRSRFPSARRTAFRLRNGQFCSCNLFLLATPAAWQAVAFWRSIEMNRKRPWRIVRAFGLRTLTAYLCRWLSLTDALARASVVFGARVQAVIMPWPEAAVDVDTPDDLALAEAIVRQRRLVARAA